MNNKKLKRIIIAIIVAILMAITGYTGSHMTLIINDLDGDVPPISMSTGVPKEDERLATENRKVGPSRKTPNPILNLGINLLRAFSGM